MSRTSRRRFVGLLCLACSLTVVAACSAILGIEPGTPAPESNDAGDAATDTTTSSSNDSAPPPPPPDGGIDPLVAARAAVFMASCVFDSDGINRQLQQIYLEHSIDAFRSRTVFECLAAKTNGCIAVRECMGITLSNDAGPCDSGCTGTLYEECAPPNALKIECSTIGYACKKVAYCAANGAQDCDPATFQGDCENGGASGCPTGWVVRGYRCADLGTSCEDMGGVPKKFVCRGTRGACVSTTTTASHVILFEGQRCENGKLVACVNHGLATVDCGTIGKGFSCFDVPGGETNATAYCGTAAECSPKSPWTKVAGTCEGSSVVFCNGGRIEKVDCTQLGFTGCNNGLCQPKYP